MGIYSHDWKIESIGRYPETEADRWAHFRKSLGGVLAVTAVFYATLGLVIALAAAVGSH